jgi:hypothetical protein
VVAVLAGALATAALAGCGGGAEPARELAADEAEAGPALAVGGGAPRATPTTRPALPSAGGVAPAGTVQPPQTAGTVRPAWLGTRLLPLGPDGFGVIAPTPPELADRRLPPPEPQAAPASTTFRATVEMVAPEVASRSTWDPACPVGLDELRHVRVSFWGFDERPHTGELLILAELADDVVEVFASLFRARFPIEEMRITRAEELNAHPTGDGNNTGAFVCRPSRGTTSWSEHAYGRAVDINPFHNPYLKGDVVLPELASAYADRSAERPGMILDGGVVTDAFAGIGWRWGGDWRSSKDYMHFSPTGR